MKTYNQADTYDSDLSGNDYDFTPTSHRVPFFMSNGITLFAYKTDNAESKSQYKAKGSFNGEFMNLYIDINGPKTKPNVIGKDIFYFKIDNRGAVIPWAVKHLNGFLVTISIIQVMEIMLVMSTMLQLVSVVPAQFLITTEKLYINKKQLLVLKVIKNGSN